MAMNTGHYLSDKVIFSKNVPYIKLRTKKTMPWALIFDLNIKKKKRIKLKQEKKKCVPFIFRVYVCIL